MSDTHNSQKVYKTAAKYWDKADNYIDRHGDKLDTGKAQKLLRRIARTADKLANPAGNPQDVKFEVFERSENGEHVKRMIFLEPVYTQSDYWHEVEKLATIISRIRTLEMHMDQLISLIHDKAHMYPQLHDDAARKFLKQAAPELSNITRIMFKQMQADESHHREARRKAYRVGGSRPPSPLRD